MIPKNRRDDDDHDNDSGDIRADSDFLAYDDRAIRDFRESEKESKKMIVKHMVKLRHNLQYNKHLLSVYLKAKAIFDEMVDEHRTQIHHLDEIYKHLSKLINEQLMKKNKPSKKLHRGDRDRDQSDINHDKPMLKELVKDKKNIGKLLSNMRKGLDKLMEIDTIIGTTIDKINEIQFIEDNDEKDEKDEGDEGDIEDDEDSASEEEDEDEDEDSASEEEDDESASEQEEDEDSASEDEDDADEEDEDESASEQEDEEDEDESASEQEDEAEEEEEDSASDEEDSTSEDDDREPIVFY